MSIRTRTGWRYVVKIPMGIESAVWVSKDLYPTQGSAIDAMSKAYPESDYPDAKRSIIMDDEPIDE